MIFDTRFLFVFPYIFRIMVRPATLPASSKAKEAAMAAKKTLMQKKSAAVKRPATTADSVTAVRPPARKTPSAGVAPSTTTTSTTLKRHSIHGEKSKARQYAYGLYNAIMTHVAHRGAVVKVERPTRDLVRRVMEVYANEVLRRSAIYIHSGNHAKLSKKVVMQAIADLSRAVL